MTATNARVRIVTLPGDGIGQEVVPAALHVLEVVQSAIGGFRLEVEERRDMGALQRLRPLPPRLC